MKYQEFESRVEQSKRREGIGENGNGINESPGGQELLSCFVRQKVEPFRNAPK